MPPSESAAGEPARSARRLTPRVGFASVGTTTELRPPSSSGLGYQVLILETGVRVPVGAIRHSPCNRRGFHAPANRRAAVSPAGSISRRTLSRVSGRFQTLRYERGDRLELTLCVPRLLQVVRDAVLNFRSGQAAVADRDGEIQARSLRRQRKERPGPVSRRERGLGCKRRTEPQAALTTHTISWFGRWRLTTTRPESLRPCQ